MKVRSSLPVRNCVTLALLALFASCGGHKATIGDGVWQKRQHRAGWHWDPGFRASKKNDDHRPHSGGDHRDLRLPRSVPSFPTSMPDRPLLAATHPVQPVLAPQEAASGYTSHEGNKAEVGRLPDVAPGSSVHHPAERTQQRSDGENRAWNPWAVPAFIVGLGTVAYAILGTSALLAVLGVTATLVLAAIAIRKGRTNEWKGKGFAIAALMIGTLSALITIIALIAGG